jgi:hypothetical protein
MRKAVVWSVPAVVALGVLGIVIHALIATRSEAQTLGVYVRTPVAALHPGDQACEGPVALAERISRVKFFPATPGFHPGPPIAITVRSSGSHRRLATGSLAGGFNAHEPQFADLGPAVAPEQLVDVCFRHAGTSGTLQLYGDRYSAEQGAGTPSSIPTNRNAVLSINGKQTGGDIEVIFPYAHPRSLASLLPRIIDRAAVWRPSWITPGVYWVLLALLVIGCPLLLTRALIASVRDDGAVS